MTTIVARWQQTSDYYRLLWQDAIRCRTRFRKWIVPLAIVSMLVGLVALVTIPPVSRLLPLAIILLSIGAFELAWHHWDKARWFRAMNNAAHAGEVRLQFDPGGIQHQGPTSRGEMSWTAIETMVRGEHGVFLVLQRGLSIYVPFASFADAAEVDQVEGMLLAAAP